MALMSVDDGNLILAVTAGGPLIVAGLVLVGLFLMANATVLTAEESRTTNDLLRQLVDKPSNAATAFRAPPGLDDTPFR